MSGVILAHDILIVGGFIAVGGWLEGVGKVSDWFDKLLAARQLAFLGLVIVAAERIAA